ncbi:hypothetical protein KDN24_19600 [Bacillus sp. Bva_UNVM-123]|uniref:hypothetical protein n=1 Tax=Bacillus sp. Bva_UNVM-123 TaxID=2829798 RepID=UPI00391F1D03
MRKLIMSFVFCIILALTTQTKLIQASMETENRTAFLTALDEQLESSEHYFDKGSVSLVDGFHFTGTIVKVITPKTETKEEVVKEYTSQIAVGFVEFNEIRDQIFTFKTTAFYYYDLDNKEFLTASHVFLNEEVKEFFDLYKFDLKKQSTVGTQIVIMLLLSLIIIVPVLIMIFHNKGRSTVSTTYQYNLKGEA